MFIWNLSIQYLPQVYEKSLHIHTMEVNVDNCLEPVAKEIQTNCEKKSNDPETVKNQYHSESITEGMQLKSEEKVNEIEPIKKEYQLESSADEIQINSDEKYSEVRLEEKENQTESVAKGDPFAYLDRDDFTSEKYKIEIRNLPKHYGIAVSTFKRTQFMKYEYFLLFITTISL